MDFCPACRSAIDSDPNFPNGTVGDCAVCGPEFNAGVMASHGMSVSVQECRHLKLWWGDDSTVRCNGCDFSVSEAELNQTMKDYNIVACNAFGLLTLTTGLPPLPDWLNQLITA